MAGGTTSILLVALTAPGGAAQEQYDFGHLDPGGPATLAERLPVNVVFIGYDLEQIPRQTFVAGLPVKTTPVVRLPELYGIKSPLGIDYTYDYRLTYANRAYEEAFFNQLKRRGHPVPLTPIQAEYNAQMANSREITSNFAIDAPAVERWLARNPPRGVDTRRPTVFLINWWGRKDFRYHVYTKTGEPSPDTGVNFGRAYPQTSLNAWGGTPADDPQDGRGLTRRVWFHDLSAGPDLWSQNGNVDDDDLDGDQVPDYRIPVSWEYGPGRYRAASQLPADLSKLTRYVAIDALFTASPLYDPGLGTPAPPRSINLDYNVYEGWPGVDASSRYLRPAFIQRKISKLRWRNVLSSDVQDLALTGQSRTCYETWLAGDQSCDPAAGLPAFADLFLDAERRRAKLLDDQGTVDREVPVVSYAVDPALAPGDGLLGYADDNWRDGRQSYAFTFVSADAADFGYGLTWSSAHEIGHYLGLSHPQDGYDSETGVDFGPTGPFAFTYAGSQVNSTMSYSNLNFDFSQFDRDNSDRWLTATYATAANTLAAAVLADSDARSATARLRQADRLLGHAEDAFAHHRYRLAYALADRAYQQVVRAAEVVGVDPEAVGPGASRRPRTVVDHDLLVDRPPHA